MLKRLLAGLAILSTIGLSAAQEAKARHIVFMIGEDEYHTWETLPEFAK